MWTRITDESATCASASHDQSVIIARWRMNAGDVGSFYCDPCKRKIEDASKSPLQQAIDKARGAAVLALLGPKMEARPISEIPMRWQDGREVLIWWRFGGWSICRYVPASDDDDTMGWRGEDDDCLPTNQHDATHFLPMPPAPNGMKDYHKR